MNKSIFATVIVATLGLGLAVGYWLATSVSDNERATGQGGEREVLFYRNPMNPAITSPVPAQDEMGMDYIPVYADEEKTKPREPLYYRNPMNPAITSPVPAQDEMGMDYIPVYADDEQDTEVTGSVNIDPVTVQNIGVRTAAAKIEHISRRLNALGRVDFDEERLARLHPRTSGWIEKLRIDETGVQIEQDAILLDIYSPDLVAAQREYLVAMQNGAGGRGILDSARQRLELFAVPEHQIRELEKSRQIRKSLHIHSPVNGRVMHIGVREGQYVTPKDELYLIADLSRIWVYVEVFEDQLPWIKVGDRAEMRVRAAPGRTFEGNVSFIYPTLDKKTRSVRVRLEFDNPDTLLKPGMFANVTLHVDQQKDSVVVPSEAIVRSGEREQVFIARGEGKFEPREVSIGLSAGGLTQVLSGLEGGEHVVTSAQFLIDSESKLREATAKMMAAMKGADADMDMSNMQMEDMDMSGMSMDEMSMDDMNMSDMSMDDMDMSDMSMDEK